MYAICGVSDKEPVYMCVDVMGPILYLLFMLLVLADHSGAVCYAYPSVDSWDSIVLINVHPLCLQGKILSHRRY
jgi:hypothetical protein